MEIKLNLNETQLSMLFEDIENQCLKLIEEGYKSEHIFEIIKKVKDPIAEADGCCEKYRVLKDHNYCPECGHKL